MKKLLYLLAFCPFASFAQHSTTETEFNYLTKGYAVDMSEGRDIKAGYRLDPIGAEVPIDTYTFAFSSFTKLDEKATAAILVVVKSKTWNNTYYLCIPLNNPDLNQRYYNEILGWDAQISHAYAYISSSWAGSLAAMDINAELQK